MPCLHRSARGGRGELVGVRDRSVHPSERSWPARPVRARPFRRDLPHPSNALCTLVLCACRSGWNALEDRSDRPRRRLCAAPGPSAAPRPAAAASAPLPRSPRAAPVLRTAPGRAHGGARTADRGGTRSTTALIGRAGGCAPRPAPPMRPAPPPPRPRPHLAHHMPHRCSESPLTGHTEGLSWAQTGARTAVGVAGAARDGGSRWRCSLPTPPGPPDPRRPAPELLTGAARAVAHFPTVHVTVTGGEGAQSTSGSVGDPRGGHTAALELPPTPLRRPRPRAGPPARPAPPERAEPDADRADAYQIRQFYAFSCLI